MNIIMSYFCFLLVHTASPFGHIARYAPSTTGGEASGGSSNVSAA